MNKKYTVEQFLKDLMNLQDDNSDEALELSYKACDLLIDSHGMLIHENVIYLRKHDVICSVGESDSYGILTLILRWPDLCGHLHEMLVG
jgi:hypothetical protein